MAELVYTDAHTAVSGHAAGHDTTAVSLLVLHDHNANVVGLADEDGNIAAQYSWSPYGELRAVEYDPSSLTSAEAVAAAKGNRLGHQGLRMERFDRPWDGALDLSTVVTSGTNATGEYRAIASNRNRMYDPGVGRFLEVDPNGLGVPVLGAMAHSGMALDAWDITPNVRTHFDDGINAHSAYLSSPSARRDPTGLTVAELPALAESASIWSTMASTTLKALSGALFVRDLRLAIDGQQSWLYVAFDLTLIASASRPAMAALDATIDTISYARTANNAASAARGIGATGVVGETWLATLGGRSQVYFKTSLGGRFVDQLVGTVANESKVGYVTLEADIQLQVAKDAELLQTGQVSEVVWHFFTSPVTGQIGPSAPS